MAQKRMFSKKIIGSDTFCDMPLSAQALYFHICLAADDDGFLDNARSVKRRCGASEDDLKLLIAKAFLITFESDVVVVRQWRVHNTIRLDRYTPTEFTREAAMLRVRQDGKDRGAYAMIVTPLEAAASGNQLATNWQPTGNPSIRLRVSTKDSNTTNDNVDPKDNGITHPEEEDIYNTNTAFCAGARAREERLFRKYGVLDAAILLSELDAEPVKKAFGDTVDAVLDAAEAQGWKPEMIGLAINKAVKRGRRGHLESPAAYAITLLEDWAERGLDSPEAVAEAKGDFSHYGS